MALLKMYLIALAALNFGIYVWRWSSTDMRHAQLCRMNDMITVQFFMAIFSTILYRRICALSTKQSSNLRGLLRFAGLVFIAMAHFSWFCFYIYLPDNSLLAVISFLSVSIYVHLSVFLVPLIALEIAVDHFLPNMSNFLLKSKNFHTLLAFVLAFALTGVGIPVTQQTPTVRHENIYIAGLAPELEGFSIALMTDVHVGPTVGKGRIETIVGVMNELDADVVTIVGDLVDGFVGNLGRRALPLERLRARYGKFFVTGNHEYYHGDINQWVDFFRSKLNLTVLRNANHVVRSSKTSDPKNSGRGTVCMVGVDDMITEHLFIHGHKMDAEKALASCPPESTIVLLAHQPNAAKKIIDSTKRQIHLILSGHTHGGQFYIFWALAYWRNAFLHGLYRDSETGTQVFVSSGVNYWGPPVKIWNLCEVVLLKLHRGKQGVISEFDSGLDGGNGLSVDEPPA